MPTTNQPVCILIVDDQPNNLKLLTRVFQDKETILTASSGQEALKLIDSHKIDLILLDIMIPDISGLHILEHVRKHPDIADLPIILISALTEKDQIIRGLELGANDYIVKPYDIDIVRARANTQLTLKRLQDQHKQALIDMQAANDLKERFLQIVSHDLKNPLNNVRLAQFLLREQLLEFADENAEAQPHTSQWITLLDTIETSANITLKVIGQFLETAALESGQIELKCGYIAVQELFDKIKSRFSLQAANKAITLNIQHTDAILYADSQHTEQILANLVSNALKYSPQNATVNICAKAHQDRIRLYVTDQGEGIPESDRQRLFTAFGKLSTRPTNGEGSTGLGLWIVKQLTEIQKGSVGVEFPESGGSSFWVELPAAEA